MLPLSATKASNKLKIKIHPYMAFLWDKSMYLFLMSSRLEMSWWKDSRSMTRQETPSGSSAMMLAVLFSSLEKAKVQF